MKAPLKFLALLDIAETSYDGLLLVREILNVAGFQAYVDVHKPFGARKADRWLMALLKPTTWRKHPSWIRALEERLRTLSVRRPIGSERGLHARDNRLGYSAN